MATENEYEKKETHIDDVLRKLSLFERYYSVFLFLMLLLILINGMTSSNYIFTAEKTKYRCKDDLFGNNTCISSSNSSEVCKEWIYDNPHSFVAEFQLACQEWKRTLVGTVHNFGYGAGLLIIGLLSDNSSCLEHDLLIKEFLVLDKLYYIMFSLAQFVTNRIGRKKIIVITGVLGSIFGVARSFSVNYWIFIVLEFLEAAFGDVYSPAFILIMEMVPHDKRVLSKMFCSFGLSLGYGFLSLSAWLFPYWRNLLRVMYAPTIIIFFYIYLIDESPRWLLSKHRKDEAIAVIENMAKRSNVEVDKTTLNEISYEQNHEGSFGNNLKHTLTSGIMLQRFLICLIWWTTSSFVEYGLRINAVLLPGNKYINYGMFMVADIVANSVNTYVLIRFRRKIPLMCMFAFAAVLCFSQAFVPRSLVWLAMTLLIAGKMMSSSFFSTTYLYTSEIFPTYTRNSMHALCSSLGRVGSVLAPQTPLLIVYWSGAPLFVFGCASLVAVFATMFAPDTADDSLPDNVLQAEVLGTKNPKITYKRTETSLLYNHRYRSVPTTIPTGL